MFIVELLLGYREYRDKNDLVSILFRLSADRFCDMLSCSAAFAAPKLPAYNVKIDETTVSGLSAGGYFAVQMHGQSLDDLLSITLSLLCSPVGYSDIIRGAAIFAGGPYHCALGQMSTALTTCMTAIPGPNLQTYVTATNNNANAKLIADTKLLNNASVYLFSGTSDATVKPVVMNTLQQYYLKYVKVIAQSVLSISPHLGLMQPEKVKYVNTMAAAHTQPTDDPINTNRELA